MKRLKRSECAVLHLGLKRCLLIGEQVILED